MAWIQTRIGKNGKKTYTATIRIKGVSSQTATFDRLTDAKKWSQSIESSIREGRHLGFFEAKRHTLAEVIDRYLEDPSINIKTKENYNPWLAWWKNEIGEMKLSEVTPGRISKIRDKLLKTPLAPKKKGAEEAKSNDKEEGGKNNIESNLESSEKKVKNNYNFFSYVYIGEYILCTFVYIVVMCTTTSNLL